MKQQINHLRLLFMALILFMAGPHLALGGPVTGQPAPSFTLQDVAGTSYDLSKMTDTNLMILYFFDTESRPSQEGLLNLDQLRKQYKDADLTVWAITLSDKDKTEKFIHLTKPDFPVLLDTGDVSDAYQARLVLPTVWIIGPGLKLLDHFHGGGKTTEVMLVRLAERQLQRRQTRLAQAISAQVAKNDPANVQARTVMGYASLQEGNTDDAEKIFQDLAEQKGQAAAVGKEGLAALYAASGDTDKALNLAREVEQQAPDRAYPHVIKGNILYSQNKKQEAEAEFEQAVHKKEAEPFQKAIAYNQYGRLYATRGKFEKSRELYDQAIALDPYYVEATSNKGFTYEKEGQWSMALDAYRKAMSLDKNDTFAAILAKKAEEMLTMQKDVEKKKRIDALVKELADRYRKQQKSGPKNEDTWTSRPMVLTFVDLQEKGGLAERDGFSTVLTSELGSELNASGRVKVVERVLLDRLLEELNLGSSDLADPETALRLGKVLAAKLIGSGSLYYLPDSTLLSLRLIDTETSAIPKVITQQFEARASLDKELHALNRELLKTIILKYPLQGYVVQATAGEALINLGSDQGVVLGTRFDVIEEPKPIEYKGKKLQGLPQAIGQIEIVRVEPSLSHGRIVHQGRPLQTDDRIKERIEPETTL